MMAISVFVVESDIYNVILKDLQLRIHGCEEQSLWRFESRKRRYRLEDVEV